MNRKLVLAACALLLLPVLAGCEAAAGQVLAQFELGLEPEELQIPAGESDKLRVTVKPLTGIPFNAVSVQLIGKPVGVAADREPLLVFTENDWTISVAAEVIPGDYELEVGAVGEGLNLIPVTKSRAIALTVGQSGQETSGRTCMGCT